MMFGQRFETGNFFDGLAVIGTDSRFQRRRPVIGKVIAAVQAHMNQVIR